MFSKQNFVCICPLSHAYNVWFDYRKNNNKMNNIQIKEASLTEPTPTYLAVTGMYKTSFSCVWKWRHFLINRHFQCLRLKYLSKGVTINLFECRTFVGYVVERTADELWRRRTVSTSLREQYGCVFDRRLENLQVVGAGGETPLRRLFRACEKLEWVTCVVFWYSFMI